MSTEVVKAETFGIEETKANEMTSGLDTILAEREILKEAYLDVIDLEVTPENIKVFKELRLKIRNNRTKGINNWHTKTKAFFLAGGRFVDAKKNMEIAVNEDWESKLLAAEKTYENIELARIEALRVERMAELEKYDVLTNEANVQKMTESVWDSYLNGVRLNYEDVKAKEAQAEAERIAQEKKEAEEREAQRLENIRLKEEAEKKKELRGKRSKELQPYIVFIRDYNGLIEADNEDYKKQFDEIKKGAELQIEYEIKQQKEEAAERERLAKIEADKQAKIKAEADAKIKAEKEAREKAENEAKAAQEEADKLIKEAKKREEAEKLEAERKAKEEAAAKKAYEQAPDKDKLKKAIETVRESFEPLSVKDKDVRAIAKEIESKLIGWFNWANKEVDALK